MKKVRKSSNIGQDQKIYLTRKVMIFTFAQSLTTIAKNLFIYLFGGGRGREEIRHYSVSPSNFETFFSFSNLLSRSATCDATRIKSLLY